MIRKSRAKKVVEEILGKEFKGIISCDGWKTYESFSDRLQRCWAHLLRESYHLKENHKDFEKYHEILKVLFNKILEIRLKPPSEEKRRELAGIFILKSLQERLRMELIIGLPVLSV